MQDLKFIKIFAFICILIQICQSEIVDKWHKTEDLPTFFIDAEMKYNWFEAWNECASRNMTLVAIDTSEKHSDLNEVLRAKFVNCPNLWIGAHDLAENRKFIWSSTGKRFDFSNWSNGNPDNYNNAEHCVHFYDVANFEWNDAPCTSKFGFICEENHFVAGVRRELEKLIQTL